MLSIRLSRVGKKNTPLYRLIVTEKRRDPWGKNLEILGFYNPRLSAEISNIKEERLKHWLKIGAKLTPTVHNLLVNQGIIKEEKVRIVKPKKKEEKKTETSASTVAPEESAKSQPSSKPAK